MKPIAKIVILSLLFILRLQGVEAETTFSAMDKCVFSAIESQKGDSSEDVLSLDGLFVHPMFAGMQKTYVEFLSNSMDSYRKAEELQQLFLKTLIGRFSLREETLATGMAKIFTSTPIHCVSPACYYYVFALRRILI